MCGRYYIEIEETELQEIVDTVEKNMVEDLEQTNIKLRGEIFPTNIVTISTHEMGFYRVQWKTDH